MIMTFTPNQMSLVTSIMRELDKQAKKQGIKGLVVPSRHANAIIDAANGIVREFGAEEKRATSNMGLDAWLASDDTGISSKTMAGTIFDFKVKDKCHPWDPSDFGRCHRFLEAVPGARERLSAVKEVSPIWTRMIEAWDELTALYMEESPKKSCPKLYARMKELIAD